MKIHTATANYVAFSLSENELIGETEALKLVKAILNERLLPCWENISIEIFTGSHGALCLAHPMEEIKISVSPFLLPFLNEYFTE